MNRRDLMKGVVGAALVSKQAAAAPAAVPALAGSYARGNQSTSSTPSTKSPPRSIVMEMSSPILEPEAVISSEIRQLNDVHELADGQMIHTGSRLEGSFSMYVRDAAALDLMTKEHGPHDIVLMQHGYRHQFKAFVTNVTISAECSAECGQVDCIADIDFVADQWQTLPLEKS